MSLPLANPRVAVVTGASRNLGEAIARRLASDGFVVAINYHNPQAKTQVNEIILSIESRGGQARGYQFDIADESAVAKAFGQICKDLGFPQVLVNNAASSVASNISWDDISVEQWDKVIATNLRGTFLCSRTVAPLMKEIGLGSIINISSIRAVLGMQGNLHYTTTKSGILGFTRVLARELGADNIRVNSLIVGAIKTEDESAYGSEREMDAQVMAQQALKWRGLPSDVADSVSFFAGPQSNFVTGQSLVVDGGWVMD